jgi:hypothetical protein
LKVAIKQNKNRDRVVPEDILIDTHKGASRTMRDILEMGSGIKKYLDGDIYFSFNNIEEGDVELDKSKVSFTDKPVFKNKKEKDKPAIAIKKATYTKIKSAGKNMISIENLKSDVLQKIIAYTPAEITWKK